MASTSPKATRTATSTPTRGRGRGRPRLYARGTSSAMSRKRIPLLAQRLGDGTPTARRRPAQFHHGYRPGGAGGGGRYIDPITGEEIPAAIFREMLKSAEKGGIGGSLRRPPPPPPSAPPAVGPDGVYKPREERSYTEFHPGFDAEQPLLAYSAQEIDGDDYQPLSLVDNKSVKTVNVKEEDETRGESGSISIADETDITMLNGNDAEERDQQRAGFQYNDSIDRPTSGTAASPVSPASNGAPTTTEVDYSSVATDANGVGRLSSFQMPSNNSAVNDLPIDPTLAALTPPPPASTDSASSLPIDPALVSDESGPGQTQTPAATPTDGSGKEEMTVLAPTPPPMTPAGPGVGVSPQKRASNDVPTLASLRSHRTTAGKPPPRSMPPTTARRPRSQNQKPHEELNLRAPSFREIQPFKFAWSSEVGSKGPRGLNNPQTSNDAEPMSDKMLAVGYQQSSEFKCPDTLFRDHPDVGIDEELGSTDVELVEYDMDEQDDKWLTNYNSRRLMNSDTTISREMFELVMTKIEKAWVNLERKMPKVQAKPHGIGLPNRRRSSGRAGDDEDDDGAEDSKCAICDDGECENANAIVFCDGCNLAVHQECYGVPYIPEGQWHCRKCQQIPRQIANCVFCPNTDGAFKQTTTNRWAHLLCAIWIPEVRLANPSFMEPVEGVELVPRSRWKLNCYICKQRMGACIQCSHRNCFLAFHVTCGRRARLHMKMKNSSGPGAQLESSGLKALCDRHVPVDWREENDVDNAIEDAMDFYATNYTGRDWGDSHAAAMTGIATEDIPQRMLPRGHLRLGDRRVAIAAEPKAVWKLPSGAPVIPRVVYSSVAEFLSRFGFTNVGHFAAETCKYWTLKREARRGASLVRRLQVHADSNSFTSIEVVRKNYASMGRVQGTKKLEQRKDFAGALQNDLIRLMDVVKEVRKREDGRAKESEMMKAYVDAMYFPELPLMRDILNRALKLDHDKVFATGFTLIRERLESRLYPTVSFFITDIRSVLQSPASDPRLEFDIRVKVYTPPPTLFPTPAVSQVDSAAVGEKILRFLQSNFDGAVAKEKALWVETQRRPAQKTVLLEPFNGGHSAMDYEMLSPDSPSAQLVNEAPRTTLKATNSSPLVPNGSTVLGALVDTLSKELAMGKWDYKSSSWVINDYRQLNLEPDHDVAMADYVHYQSASPEKPGPFLQTQRSTPLPETNGPGILENAQVGISTSLNCLDEDMEDAPGEVDEEFLSHPAPLETTLGTSPTAQPEQKTELDHSDLHDEDAEGEIDDDLSQDPLPTHVPVPHITSVDLNGLPEIDSAPESVGNEDDLLGGYRPEDLPSPLGDMLGEPTTPATATGATHSRPMLDMPHATYAQGHDIDLPDLPQHGLAPSKLDLENMTNTSVLSDYPDDLDEAGQYGLFAEGTEAVANGDANRNVENEAEADTEVESTPRRSRRSTAFKGDLNGRATAGSTPSRSRNKRKRA